MTLNRAIGELVLPVENVNPARGGRDTFRYIDIASIDRESKAILHAVEVEALKAPSRARQLVRAGDVLVSTVRPNLNAVAQVPPELDGSIASTGFTVLRPDPKEVHPRYLFNWVKSPQFVSRMVRAATGASYPAVNDRIIKECLMPTPADVLEQNRIAAVLDKADALRQKRRLTIQKVDTFLQSVFLDMFGDPRANSKGWRMEPFGSLATNEDAVRVPVKSSDRREVAGEFPYYGASGIIDYVDDYLFEGQRLLIAEDGANLIARSSPVAFIADGRYWVNNHAHVVAFNGRATLRYLEGLFSFLDLKPYVTGSAQPKLNRSNLDRIPIPVPDLSLQNRYDAIFDSIAKVSTKHRAAKLAADRLFGSLQQRAFSAKLIVSTMGDSPHPVPMDGATN